MFYLAGPEFPTSREELEAALTQGIAQAVALPAGGRPVRAEGEFPELAALTIDLSGGRIDPAKPVPPPKPVGHPQRGITVQSLRLLGKPLQVGAGRAFVDVAAEGVRFDFDRDAANRPLLVPAAWQSGRLAVEVPHADLEAIVLSGAKAAAARQGVTIVDTRLKLTSLGERSVAVEMRATAKKMFLQGRVTLFAQLDVDEQFNARVSHLDCRGEGMLGTMAQGMIRQKLVAFEGREFPLADYVLAGVRLRGLKLDAGDPLRVTAEFGE